MPRTRPEYSSDETRRDTAIAFLRARVPRDLADLAKAKDGHIQEAAKRAGVHPQLLAHWVGAKYGIVEPPPPDDRTPNDAPWGGPDEETDGDAGDTGDAGDEGEGEYYLPEEVADPARERRLFVPAHRLGEWVRETFILGGGALEVGDHWHLRAARLGFLWTNVLNGRGPGRLVAGMAEQPGRRGNKWQTGRDWFLLERWFGCVPEFVITLDAPNAATLSDAEFCSLLDHELRHCGVAVDDDGLPRETPDGDFIWRIAHHDAEEFERTVELFGADVAAAGVPGLIRAGNARPQFTEEEIAAACAPLRRHDPPY